MSMLSKIDPCHMLHQRACPHVVLDFEESRGFLLGLRVAHSMSILGTRNSLFI